MRIHAVGLPHSALDGVRNPDCAFTQRLLRWSRMMTGRGHEVYLYGGPGGETPPHIDCTEFIECAGEYDYKKWFDSGKTHAVDPKQLGVPTYNDRLIREIKQRIQPKDFILITWGYPQWDVAKAFPDNISIEGAIGYGSRVLPFAVFDTYAWMHYMYGKANQQQGNFFDTAILGPFDPNEFLEAKAHKGYLLFIGRLTPLKGIGVAQSLAEATDMHLVVCGGGDESLLTSERVDYKGVVDHEERARLLQHATALVAPTQYIEPGGQVVVEAAMAGVPAITTDFGCFPETNSHGWRFHTMSEAAQAVTLAVGWELEDRRWLQNWARHEYGFENVYLQWKAYLDRLSLLYGPGFYG